MFGESPGNLIALVQESFKTKNTGGKNLFGGDTLFGSIGDKYRNGFGFVTLWDFRLATEMMHLVSRREKSICLLCD